MEASGCQMRSKFGPKIVLWGTLWSKNGALGDPGRVFGGRRKRRKEKTRLGGGLLGQNSRRVGNFEKSPDQNEKKSGYDAWAGDRGVGPKTEVLRLGLSSRTPGSLLWAGGGGSKG